MCLIDIFHGGSFVFSTDRFAARRQLYEKHAKSNGFVALQGALRRNLFVRF
jgi:hypothetical protein